MNHFAFSSLGELEAFTTGIGPARMMRIQSIDITWIGSQRLTIPPKGNGGISPFSKRTTGLANLIEMRMLSQFTMRIDTQSRMYWRRAYEPSYFRAPLVAAMDKQSDRRQTRSLRCVQGADYVFQLRGLKSMRVFELSSPQSKSYRNVRYGRNIHGHSGRECDPVEDWSFTSYLVETTMDSRNPDEPLRYRVHNLKPLMPSWAPAAHG